MDDQIAAGAEGARAELADVIPLVWEEKKRDRGLVQPGKTIRMCFGSWENSRIRERFWEQRAAVTAPRGGKVGV